MQKKILFHLLLLFVVFPSSCQFKNEERKNTNNNDYILGKVIRIVDGDTYHLLTEDNQTLKIRMEGIDAPERAMPFYKVSKDYLGKLCFGKRVKLKSTSIDQYGRHLGFTYLEDGSELCHEMIKAGLAWHYKHYNSDVDLANLEIEARKSKKGIWSDKNPMAPWENRRLHRQGISTKDSFK